MLPSASQLHNYFPQLYLLHAGEGQADQNMTHASNCLRILLQVPSSARYTSNKYGVRWSTLTLLLYAIVRQHPYGTGGET